MLTSSRTEARKQAAAEEEYYHQFEPQQQEKDDQRHDSKVSAHLPDHTVPGPVPNSANRTPHSTSTSPIDDLSALIARAVIKRRGSDDSVKTAYATGEEIPDSAYRSRSDLFI